MPTPRIQAPRRLQFEFLERREVMAASAAFKSGVLTINGTDGADVINLRQTAGKISIASVSGSWSAADVKSIVINLKGGNDSVSLASTSNGGNQTLAEEVTINSGGGNESVRLNDGRTVTFVGTGHVLKVSSAGAPNLDGKAWNGGTKPTPAPTPNPTPGPTPNPTPPPTNWFDSHIVDAAMRSLGSTLFRDGLIDRSDILALLRDAEDGGVVDATEFSDLQKIVGNTTAFGSLDYVRTLTTYVVVGNAANATFQGSALGNLSGGSASAQLEKLVGKWFLGSDRPLASSTYRQVAGQLFVGGASYTDVKQGYVGDCYFMATLAEVALKNSAAITNMFVANSDGTFTVKFYNGGQAAYVTVDRYLPTNTAGNVIYAGLGMNASNAGNELWTALAEKAYVQLNEMGWERAGLPGSGQNSYAAIEGGYCYRALAQVTGQATTPFTTTASSGGFSAFVAAFNQGKMIEFASMSQPASSSVVGGHAYAVIGYNATTQTVTLFNPWGTGYAPVVMTWAEIQGNFSYFDRTA